METNKVNKPDIFLENYDKGNKVLESLLNSSSTQILSDIDTILSESTEVDITNYLTKLKENLNNIQENPYNKIINMGNILNSSLPKILSSQNKLVLGKSYNILSSYLGLAKDSQDSRILDSANQIIGNLKSSKIL